MCVMFLKIAYSFRFGQCKVPAQRNYMPYLKRRPFHDTKYITSACKQFRSDCFLYLPVASI